MLRPRSKSENKQVRYFPLMTKHLFEYVENVKLESTNEVKHFDGNATINLSSNYF
jgi:hypothetical protein